MGNRGLEILRRFAPLDDTDGAGRRDGPSQSRLRRSSSPRRGEPWVRAAISVRRVFSASFRTLPRVIPNGCEGSPRRSGFALDLGRHYHRILVLSSTSYAKFPVTFGTADSGNVWYNGRDKLDPIGSSVCGWRFLAYKIHLDRALWPGNEEEVR